MNWEEFDERWRSRSDSQLFYAFLAELRHADGFEALWRQARAHHFGAMRSLSEDDIGDAKAALKCGITACNEALGFHPDRAEAHFWKAVCQIEAAQLAGKLAVVKAVYGARRHLEKALLADETFHFAGPLRVMGRVTHLTPRSLGGDIAKAETYFRRALEISDNSTTRLYFAELLIEKTDIEEAEELLSAIIEAPDDPLWLWEQARDRLQAQELLKKL